MKDVLILGGGLAGLSLAYRLAKKGVNITLLEKRKEYVNDRTWCFWNTQDHPFEHLVEHRWHRWQIGYNGKKCSYSSPGYEYQMIPSMTFYEAMTNHLNSLPHVSIHMGVDVHQVVCHKTYHEAITSHGVFKAKIGYDSRPSKIESSLYQHFYGWHVRLDQPAFDPSEVILMDFEGDQSKGIHFMYLLPFSPEEALIEPTFISAKPLEKSHYEQCMKDYLGKRFGINSYAIIREEKGVLPLTTRFQQSSSPHLVCVGANGGWTRSSSGYAFLAIQDAIEQLLQGSMKSKTYERFLDRTFLSFINNHPGLAPQLFATLFEKNDPGSLIRFLSGRSSILETLEVISSLPKWPFLKEVFR